MKPHRDQPIPPEDNARAEGLRNGYHQMIPIQCASDQEWMAAFEEMARRALGGFILREEKLLGVPRK